MDRKTAADILNQPATPAIKQDRVYRTHPDKLAPYWSEVEELLNHDSKLKAYALFEEMTRRHPQAFEPSWKRTFERRVRDWKIQQRIEKDVTFDQVHEPGDVLAVDFTHMNDLGIIIANQKFDHMVFHAALTYSNWEYVDLCMSESFEALAKGIQGSFHAIGGVTQRIRNDSLSAAVNNLSTDRHFTANFQQLLDHFRVESHRINVRTPRENGDCESLHGHFKDYVDQRLRLRGSREFESKDEWIVFLRECIAVKNRDRETAFRAEQDTLSELPDKLFPIFTEHECTVSSNSIITVKQNRYSIPSCFIGSRVQVRIYADKVQVWHANKHLGPLSKRNEIRQHIPTVHSSLDCQDLLESCRTPEKYRTRLTAGVMTDKLDARTCPTSPPITPPNTPMSKRRKKLKPRRPKHELVGSN